jgi:hypothetical protein
MNHLSAIEAVNKALAYRELYDRDGVPRQNLEADKAGVDSTVKLYDRSLDDSGLSGDDVNRRLREARLGHSVPTSDWEANKGKVIRCIFAGQSITRKPDSNDVFYHGPGSWAG